jgi:acetyl-CoA carboxylase biotin carboxylase subunit
MGLKTNLPFHQKLLDSTRFLAGRYDTSFVDDFVLHDDQAKDRIEVAAILATLVEHQQRQMASQIVARPKRDASNWKWVGRWERMQR